MTVIAEPLWEEGEGSREALALRHGLTAVYERDATERAVRWAQADRTRWKWVLDSRLSRSRAATEKAALTIYQVQARERREYVQQLLKRGRVE